MTKKHVRTIGYVCPVYGRVAPPHHEHADVFRLLVNNDYISYRFEERIGW